eukprot:3810111-Rhodomonas_salina.3
MMSVAVFVFCPRLDRQSLPETDLWPTGLRARPPRCRLSASPALPHCPSALAQRKTENEIGTETETETRDKRQRRKKRDRHNRDRARDTKQEQETKRQETAKTETQTQTASQIQGCRRTGG